MLFQGSISEVFLFQFVHLLSIDHQIKFTHNQHHYRHNPCKFREKYKWNTTQIIALIITHVKYSMTCIIVPIAPSIMTILSFRTSSSCHAFSKEVGIVIIGEVMGLTLSIFITCTVEMDFMIYPLVWIGQLLWENGRLLLRVRMYCIRTLPRWGIYWDVHCTLYSPILEAVCGYPLIINPSPGMYQNRPISIGSFKINPSLVMMREWVTNSLWSSRNLFAIWDV